MTAADPRSAAVIAREHGRIAAMISGDRDALALLLADDLSYVHTNALVDSRDSLLALLDRVTFTSIEREDLQVRFHGNVAILRGGIRLRATPKGSSSEVGYDGDATSVWLETDSGWLLTAYHSSKLP